MRLCRGLLATARPLPSDVWQFGAGRPRVAVLGGVHGNEITGVEVVKALVEDFTHKGLGIREGQLTVAIGNPLAVAQNTRYIEEDLNRCFDGKSLETSELEKKRAAALSPYLEGLDVLLDLHATNKPSTPFARLPGPIEGRRQRFQVAEDLFLSSLPTSCQTVLWDPHELIAGGSMTDEFALRHAPDGWDGWDGSYGSYICLESGQASDRSSVDAIYLAVLQCLRKLQMLGPLGFEGRPGPGDKKPRAWRHFEIMEKFSLDHRGFEWTNGHGEYNFQVVPAGHVYGRKGQVELRAPEGKESYMVFPKVRNLWAEGRPLGWLARKLEPEEL